MSMIFCLGYEDKVYLFSDTRVSTTINGESYYIKDGYEKVRVFGDKIVFCMGYLPTVEHIFKNIKPDHQVDDIQKLAKTTFNKYKEGEVGVYVLTVDQYGRYLLYTISSHFDFEIMTDIIKNRDIMAAGANSDMALDYACKLIGKMNPFEIIMKSYEHVADEKVGGQLIIHEFYIDDRFNINIKKYVRQIKDSRSLRRYKAHATLDGQAKFKKIQITDENNTALIDSTTRKFFLNNWDIVGAGAIGAQFIQTGTMTTDSGFINDLTVTRLKTLDKSDQIGQTVDFVQAQDNYISFITGTITNRQQAMTPEGFPLYWTDASKSRLTTEQTPYPFYNLTFNPIEKLKIYLEGQGMQSYPIIKLGAGDGVTETSGKGYIIKPTGKLDIVYYNSNLGQERRLTLEDSGIIIRVEGNGDIIIEGRNINIKANQNINFEAQNYNFA